MNSKKIEERNEKIIRGLMKLPPNRRCINCNSLGPQYVCTNFWTFICTTCSGIHREFTHRVKSVSMAKFTTQEVDALQNGGNQRAREMFLKGWDLQRQRLPDSSNIERVREFIKNVYVDKKYSGGKVSDKPPKDMQSLQNLDDETRRASSYHSYSQSPPYEYQYEDRKYGKPVGVLSRKPGSDRGHYEGKISSFAYSPGRRAEQMYEERFANEGPNSRVTDYSVSSGVDPFRSDNQSPNFQGKTSSPPMHPLKDILAGDARSQTIGASDPNSKRESEGTTRTQRTASSSSFGSFDSNSVNSSLFDVVSEPEQSAGTQLRGRAPAPSVQKSSSVGIDLFSQHILKQSAGIPAPSTDLFEKPVNTFTPSIDLFEPANSFPPSQELFKQPTNISPPSQDLFKQPATTYPPSQNLFQPPSDTLPPQNLVQQPDKTLGPSMDLFAEMNHQTWAPTLPEKKPPAVSFPQNDGWATFDFPQREASTVGVKYAPRASVASGDQVSTMNSSMQWLSASYESHGSFSLPSVENQWHGSQNEVQPFGAPTVSKEHGVTSVPTKQKSTNPFDVAFDSKSEMDDMFLNMASLQESLPTPQLPPPYVEDFNQWFPQNPIAPYIPAAPQGPVASLGGNPFA
ncbi:hypothetical protein ACHQM5_012259 [Ranunculus cassubicifolius]